MLSIAAQTYDKQKEREASQLHYGFEKPTPITTNKGIMAKITGVSTGLRTYKTTQAKHSCASMGQTFRPWQRHPQR